MAPESIEVVGLKEFSRGLRKMDKDLPKGLRLAANKAAAIVVTSAKAKIPSGPARGGHAASSVRASSTRTEARVSAGGARYPYLPWLDFGGRVGRKRSVKRPFLKEGRYVWRSFAEHRGEVYDALEQELHAVAKGAGIELG